MEITICTLYGPEKIYLDVSGHATDDMPAKQGQKHEKNICPFHVAPCGFVPTALASIETKVAYRIEKIQLLATADYLAALLHLSGLGARAPPFLI